MDLWCVSSSYTKVFRIFPILETCITLLIYLHQNKSCTFSLMYHISLKQQEIVFTHLAGMLGIFAQGVCGTVLSFILHNNIIATRRE